MFGLGSSRDYDVPGWRIALPKSWKRENETCFYRTDAELGRIHVSVMTWTGGNPDLSPDALAGLIVAFVTEKGWEAPSSVERSEAGGLAVAHADFSAVYTATGYLFDWRIWMLSDGKSLMYATYHAPRGYNPHFQDERAEAHAAMTKAKPAE